MKKWILTLGLFLVFGSAYSYDNHDFQIWSTNVQELKLDEKSKLALEEEFRFAKDASVFYYQHYDLGYVYSLNKYLHIGAGYRHINDMKNGKFKEENAPYLIATLFYKIAGFDLDDRSRFEYRIYDYQGDNWRYRNKLNIKFPWKFTKFQFRPYISDEIFTKMHELTINENRFSVGFGFKVAKNFSGEIFYMLRDTKNSGICTWTESNVLGIKSKLSF